MTLRTVTSRATPTTCLIGARRAPGRVVAGLVTAVLAGLLAGGCAQRTVWAWPPADASAGHAGAVPAPIGAMPSRGQAAGAAVLDQSIAVFPSWGFADSPGAEANRLDSTMAMRSADGFPNRLAWPSENRPDLRFEETFRISRRAEVYSFPATRPGPPRRVIVPVPVPVYPPTRPYPRPWNRPY